MSIDIIKEDKINSIAYKSIEKIMNEMLELLTKLKNRNLLRCKLRNLSKSKENQGIDTIEKFDFQINDNINL